MESVRQARNFDFRNYKRATLTRRIERRMSDRRCNTVAEYQALLEREPAEYDALLGALLIKVTSFFRDEELWDRLAQKIIPQVLSEKRGGEEIRVWSAGCATGEEAYTLGLLFAEAMGASFNTADIKVFGTDLDEKAVAYARHGVYTPQQVEGVPKRLLEAHFDAESGRFAVKKEIRRAVVFGVHNLVSDAPISRLDLLVCRNVFIYLNNSLQKRVLTRFHYALRRHGVMVLGKSELIPFASKIFEPVDVGRRIYRKNGRRDAALSQVRLINLLEQETANRAEPLEMTPTEQFHSDLVQAMDVPVVATALDGTVLSWNAAAVALWGRPHNEVLGKKLTALGLPGLSGEILIERTAMVREGRSPHERATSAMARSGNPPLQLAVTVLPLRSGGEQDIQGLVYVAQDVTAVYDLQTELTKVNAERQNAFEELQTVNEELQSSNEELETTNEELQSANEELQTTNEELQSTNEELETTNEELQSTNAELDATNRELASRTDEMNQLTFLQRTIIRSLSSAVVVLDQKGRITLWNLGAERLLGVSEQEAVGQNFWTLHLPGLARSFLARLRKAVTQNQAIRGEEVDYELTNGARGTATVAAVPVVDDGTAMGLVILFDDTTRLRSLTSELGKLKSKNHGARPEEN
ncbi:MAG: PAS domain S-box protein [Myxococcales bacterium]|nr:PAS domain S-box protein [Myxococcales bacterium]